MTGWNYDTSAAPHGEWIETIEKGGRNGERKVHRYAAPRVILATKCGKVLQSWWLPADESERRPVGRWNFLAAGEEPVAWMPWPQHPMGVRDGE